MLLPTLSSCLLVSVLAAAGQAEDPWLTFEGGEGPGKGKHVVFVSGDDEYRSEEAFPMLARILSKRFGYKCTVLFAVDPITGTIQPDHPHNIPGTHLLAGADMLVIQVRFRELPDEQMAPIVEFTNSGKPIFGLRTSTHAFHYTRNKSSPYAKWSWASSDPAGGWGQAVLGETWISHHGVHGEQSTRGVINPSFATHPILRGCRDIWGPTDVYSVVHLAPTDQVLVHGQVLAGMSPTDKPVAGAKNEPLQPLVWVRDYKGELGKTSRVICTTMGAAVDLQSEGLRRLCVNAVLWATGAEAAIEDATPVDFVGKYAPSPFGFGKHVTGKKPADYR
jgi:hypothetical protein